MSSSSKSKRSSMRPSLLSLPTQMQEEILSRTPAEDLLRSKPVCKKWNALINTLTCKKTFINEHVDHSSSSSERFLRTVDTVAIIDPVTQRRLGSPLPYEFQGPNKIDTLIHCEGLMLCRRPDWHIKSLQPEEQRRAEIAIWNPMLREVRWIEGCLARNTLFGIGYKSRSEGYKILSFPMIQFNWVDGEKPVSIYELENKTWRTLDHVTVDVQVDSSCNGVAVLGNMYWLPEEKKKKKKKGKSYILGFDFTAEAFKDVCLCPPSRGHRYLSCYSKDRLSLLQQERKSNKIEVWVSNNLADESVSFIKHFSVPSPGLPTLKPRDYMSCPAYCFVKPTSIAAWCEGVDGKGDAYCTLCKIDEGGLTNKTEIERISEQQRQPICCGHVYVPSLVPLP